jgi:hypothetical protein
MGWEKRGNATYYYSAERVGRRVVKRFVGGGRVGELAAQLDELARDEREEATEAVRREHDRLDSLDAALAPLNELADAATVAALLAAGCHRPKRGKWRKRRAPARHAED